MLQSPRRVPPCQRQVAPFVGPQCYEHESPLALDEWERHGGTNFVLYLTRPATRSLGAEQGAAVSFNRPRAIACFLEYSTEYLLYMQAPSKYENYNPHVPRYRVTEQEGRQGPTRQSRGAACTCRTRPSKPPVLLKPSHCFGTCLWQPPRSPPPYVHHDHHFPFSAAPPAVFACFHKWYRAYLPGKFSPLFRGGRQAAGATEPASPFSAP